MYIKTIILLILPCTSILLLYLQQPAFSSQEIETMHTWNMDKFGDLELTYVVDSKDKQFHQIVDRAIGEWEKELQIITFAKSRNVDRANIYFQQVTSYTMIENTGYNDEDGRENAGRIQTFSDGYSTTSIDIHILEKLDVGEKYKVVKHLFGHALGLGHSDDINDLMHEGSAITSTSISRCDKFMVFYINNIAQSLEGSRIYSEKEYDKLHDGCIKGAGDLYEDEKYDYENNEDDNEFTWFDYDNDGALTEYDVDMMCDNTTAYEGDCKKAYNWIEKTYGYEIEED